MALKSIDLIIQSPPLNVITGSDASINTCSSPFFSWISKELPVICVCADNTAAPASMPTTAGKIRLANVAAKELIFDFKVNINK